MQSRLAKLSRAAVTAETVEGGEVEETIEVAKAVLEQRISPMPTQMMTITLLPHTTRSSAASRSASRQHSTQECGE